MREDDAATIRHGSPPIKHPLSGAPASNPSQSMATSPPGIAFGGSTAIIFPAFPIVSLILRCSGGAVQIRGSAAGSATHDRYESRRRAADFRKLCAIAVQSFIF